MKKNYKNFISIFFIIITTLIIPFNCYAMDLGLGDLGSYKGNNSGSSALQSRVGTILGIIQMVGTIISVIMLIVIGIKYMIGSVEERAEYKETLKPYLIGAFILFTGTIVPQAIYQFVQNF